MQQGKAFIGLTDPKSPTNVGAVMRAAGCYQVDAVFYTGGRYDKAVKFNTDTKKAVHRIPLRSAGDDITAVIPDDVKLVCVELAEGATSLPNFQHPHNAFYLFGPEDSSLSQTVIDKADAVVYIPTVGCMNLAATVNVVLYDRLAKSAHRHSIGDELIRESRDTNNSVRVKTA